MAAKLTELEECAWHREEGATPSRKQTAGSWGRRELSGLKLRLRLALALGGGGVLERAFSRRFLHLRPLFLGFQGLSPHRLPLHLKGLEWLLSPTNLSHLSSDKDKEKERKGKYTR